MNSRTQMIKAMINAILFSFKTTRSDDDKHKINRPPALISFILMLNIMCFDTILLFVHSKLKDTKSIYQTLNHNKENQ